MGMPDAVVIGGGIAGASVAYELAADRAVVLVEAEPVAGRHSTARSAATWVPGHGVADVRALIAASGPRFARLVDELGTPPLLLPRQVLFVAGDDEAERRLAEYLAEREGGPGAAERIDPAEAERLCPALAPGWLRAAAVVDAADVDTDALHQGYLRGLRARGGEVRVSAPAERIERTGSGWRVHLGGGAVLDTPLVVDAAGAWADVVARRAGVTEVGLVPHRRTIAVVRVPDPARLRGPAERLPFVIEAADRFYFKADGDDLMCSPVDESPAEPGDAKPDPLDVALALERVEEATRLGLRSVRTSWAGLRSFVADRRPVVGSWPDAPGFAFVAGQGGSGIETSPALSAYAAAVLTGRQPAADLPQDVALFAPAEARFRM
ncbi:D-arginine dehydrogenase [Pseudonocardia thermophila]|uniref:D-arginine dehydrogenase n=1 Tax=Pseudonocardia thermophila TaxID=1848 RepID=A0A1M6W024_PSETH|nr:FAD-dependent oxidoreductase [Pseudonocardia thermophila]SHK87013.1 D-arginine dehydrogenase [Pseudonocardia thermophila]